MPSFSVDFIYNEGRFSILSHCADGQETLMCFKDPEFEKTIGWRYELFLHGYQQQTQNSNVVAVSQHPE